jgi:hypothetical protein
VTGLAGSFTSALGLPEGVVVAIIAVANFLLSAFIFAAIFKFVPSVPVKRGGRPPLAGYSLGFCSPSAVSRLPRGSKFLPTGDKSQKQDFEKGASPPRTPPKPCLTTCLMG